MKIIWAMLGGAAVGAGAALLYAPVTGSRARSLIRDKFVKSWNDVSDFAESKGRHLANKAKGYKHAIDDMRTDGDQMGAEMAAATQM